MVKVTVEYFASVREIAGKRQETLEVGDATTVEGLLHILSEMYGKEFLQHVFDENTGAPRVHLQLLVDGKSTTALQGIKTKITDGCLFTIIPTAAGG